MKVLNEIFLEKMEEEDGRSKKNISKSIRMK